MEDAYKRTHTYQNDGEKCCCTVKIFSPVISDEEEKRRMKDVRSAAAVYMAQACRSGVKQEGEKKFSCF